MYTIQEEASCTLTYLAQYTWYCLHRLQGVTRSVHNPRKTQLYTYKVCESTLSSVSTYCNSAHNSRKERNGHTLTKAGLCVFVILLTILCVFTYFVVYVTEDLILRKKFGIYGESNLS